MAQNVLAKHDENYMPAEVADKLKEQGVWQGGVSNQLPAGQFGLIKIWPDAAKYLAQ